MRSRRVRGRHDVGAVRFVHDRPVAPFDPAHGGVVVHSYDQDISERLRLAEILDVSAVNEVEHSVRKHHLLSVPPEPGSDRCQFSDAGDSPHQAAPPARGWFFMSRISCPLRISRSTCSVNSFLSIGTIPTYPQTMPPAKFASVAASLDRKSTRLNSSHGYI